MTHESEIFNVGDPVCLTDGVDRVFSDCEHGEIVDFFTAPPDNLEGIEYAEVQWADGSTSNIPIRYLELDISDIHDCDFLGCEEDDDLLDEIF